MCERCTPPTRQILPKFIQLQRRGRRLAANRTREAGFHGLARMVNITSGQHMQRLDIRFGWRPGHVYDGGDDRFPAADAVLNRLDLIEELIVPVSLRWCEDFESPFTFWQFLLEITEIEQLEARNGAQLATVIGGLQSREELRLEGLERFGFRGVFRAIGIL